MKKVRYVASEGQGDVTVEGKRFRSNGDPQEVPDALAKKLLSGKEESLKGFKFEAVEDKADKKTDKKPDESTTGSDT